MKRKYQVLLIAALLLSTQPAGGVFGQRSRTISVPVPPPMGMGLPSPTATNAPVAPPVNVPQNVKAKYEGGLFGYNKKQTGTFHFDDEGRRLIFRDKTQKEYISIPYQSIAAAYADTQSRRPTAASVIGSASIYTLPALLFKKKYRYLTMQFSDPDTRVSGVTSFKMDSKELLADLLAAVAYKAELSPRGEAFVRLNKPKDMDQDQDK